MIVTFSFACVYGTPGKGPGEGAPQLGDDRACGPMFRVFLPLYSRVALLAEQAGSPVPRARPSPCRPGLANPGASGL